MSKPEFIYVTYIATTAEKLWHALTDGEATREYWRHENVSDWQVGSNWAHRKVEGEPGEACIVGSVVETDPPRRLVVTWARPSEGVESQRRSRVTYEIEPMDTVVKLVVTHDQLEADPEMAKGISNGWPRVLSSLKSFLETGRPLVEIV